MRNSLVRAFGHPLVSSFWPSRRQRRSVDANDGERPLLCAMSLDDSNDDDEEGIQMESRGNSLGWTSSGDKEKFKIPKGNFLKFF